MSTLPPLPPGASLIGPPASRQRRDPLETLRAEGFTWTNGYRTPADTQRIREQGYKPADNSQHLDADAVDLRHPRLSPSQQAIKLRELFGDWQGARIIDEGHHRHMQLPGWGGAPGTPGTPASGLPPLPPGASLYQRGSLDATPPLDEKADRIATIRQNGFPPAEEAQLVAAVEAEPAPLVDGGRSVVLFNDQMPEQPAQQLSPEKQAELLEYARQPGVTAADLRNFGGSRGYDVNNAEAIVEARDKGRGVNSNVIQRLPVTPPNPDGAQGAFARGIGDPFNVLDETGAVVDALGLTQGRENVWNSERSFGDILYSNIDANRSILAADERDQWKSRLGGQLLTSVVLPIGAGANTPAALARIAAVEGAAAGFGAGEGNPLQRTPNAALGAAVGGTGGFLLGKTIETAAPAFRRAFGGSGPAPAVARESAFEAAPVVNDGVQNAGPTSAAKTQPQGGSLRAAELDNASDDLGNSQAGVSPGELWKLSRDELERLQGEVSASEGEKLVQALGEEGAKQFKRLDRLRNSPSPQQADEASRQFDELFADLTPDQERLIYGIGETKAQADEIAEVLREHQPFAEFDDPNLVDVIRRTVIEQRDPKWLDRVQAGTASAGEQAGFVRLMGALGALRERGRSLADLPGDILGGLEQRGWSRADAEEVLSSRLEGLMGRARSSPARPALSGPSSANMDVEGGAYTLTGPAERPRDYLDLPPLPPGASLLDDVRIGRAVPVGERASAEQIAGVAADVQPRDVLPGPTARPISQEEAEAAANSSWRDIPAPRLGRTPRKPSDAMDFVKGWVRGETSQKGLPVRIDAEDAINNGVPAELIYSNPTVSDRSKLRLRNPSVFGTRYGAMSGSQQVLRSLDSLGDEMDPVAWGFDDLAGAGRLEPENIGDLIARGLEGDESALNRADPAFGPWSEYQERAAQRAEFDALPNGPPVERLGDTYSSDETGGVISLDDASGPRPTFYEEGAPRVTGKIGNINLDRLESPEDVSRLIEQVQAKVGGFDEASRGVVTNEETRALAAELGIRPEDLLKRRRGQALNAEQLYATRVLVQKSRQVVAALAKRSLGGTDDDLAKFRNAWMRHVALEEQVTAATAEVGRALQQFKMLARGSDASGDAVKAYLRGGGGRETVEEAARKLVDLMEDPAAANSFLRNAARVRKRDMINELWINSLLSGPRTHVVNFMSNALVSLYTLPEQALTAGIGRVLGTGDRVLAREVGQRAVGMVQGAREGLRLAQRALITGEPSDAVSKVEAANWEAIPGRLGKIIRTPTRLLTASDELFKSIARSGETHALAYRKAMRSPGTIDDRLQKYRDLVSAPDGDLMKRADEAARYYTFQKTLGEGGRGIQQFTNNVPLAKFVVPFVRTPINILKFATERSVFAPALKEVREAFRAGGNERNEAIARITMGTGLSAWAVMAAHDGLISGGGPSNPRELAALRNSGWQPYSVRIGDRWVSYQRFEPISLLAGAAADFVDVARYAASRELDELALGLTTGIAKNLTSKTWLSGLSDFMEVLSDPERYGEQWAQRLAGSLAVPAVVAHAAGAMDPNLREVRSMLDSIKARIPIISQGLAARRNVWGEPIKRGDALGPDYVSPLFASRDDPSQLLQEVARLRAPLAMPSRAWRMNGTRLRLSPEQYEIYVQLAGKPARQYLETFVGSDEWRAMDDDTRRDFLKDTMEEFRAGAREDLRERYPELSGRAAGASLPPLPAGAALVR